ncbi:MAG: OmpA family protein [Putridiphycobacter sp.]|nr:OmpA family protein [Putridiphycobacter sp.]
MKKILLLVTVAFGGLLTPANAQNSTEDIAIGLQFGTIEYKGDLGNEFFSFADGVHPSIGLNLSKYVTPSFDLMGKARHGMLDRDVFTNSLYHFTIAAKYKFNNGYLLKEESLFAPYVFLGIGDALSIYTNVETGEKEAPLAEFNLPMGVGFKFNITNQWSVSLETHYNYFISDRVDGVIMGKWDDQFLYNSVGFSYNFASGKDSDGDGVKDKDDACPDVKGSKRTGGCPDADDDGIPDAKDNCPLIPGIKEEGGCPRNYTQSVKIMTKAREGLFFNTGSATIKEESYKVLDAVVKVLKENPSYKLNIDGHTDNTGDADSNMKLSQERANAAKAYMVEKGIAADRLTATGYGITKPAADNSTEEGRAKNRRVEFNITL